MERVKRLKNAAWLPFAMLFLAMLAFLLAARVRFSDDEGMYAMLAEGSLWRHLWSTRLAWSSRLIIEAVQYHMYILPLFVWRALTAGVYTLAAWSLAKLAGTWQDAKMNWVAAALVLLYPTGEMLTASWIAGSHNYIWVVALGLFAITPWRDYLTGVPVGTSRAILSLPALLYAANAEQMLAILGGALALVLVYMSAAKMPFRVYYAAAMAVYLAAVLVVLTSPGPAARKTVEVALYYPDYATIHPLVRLYNCFMLFSGRFIGQACAPFLVASGLVCLAVWRRHRDGFSRAVATLPFAAGALLGPLYPLLRPLLPALERFGELEVGTYTASSGSSYIPFLVYVLVWACLLAAIWLALPRGENAALTAALFAGLCSQLVLAFSASIYVSAPRFYIHLHFALLAVALFAAKALRASSETLFAKLYGGFLVAGPVAYLALWLSI